MTTATAQAKPTTEPDPLITPEEIAQRQAVLDAARLAVLDAERARWLTIEEAAYVLRISPNTLYQAIHREQIDLFAVGRSWRIHVDSLVQCQKTLEGWKGAPHTPSLPITPRSHPIVGRRGRMTE